MPELPEVETTLRAIKKFQGQHLKKITVHNRNLRWKVDKNLEKISENQKLVSLNRNGTVSKRRFRLNLNKDASNKYNPLLKNGDIVRINRTKIATGTDALIEVTKPFSAVLNAISLYKLLD